VDDYLRRPTPRGSFRRGCRTGPSPASPGGGNRNVP
jgi:hypothetical protein